MSLLQKIEHKVEEKLFLKKAENRPPQYTPQQGHAPEHQQPMNQGDYQQNIGQSQHNGGHGHQQGPPPGFGAHQPGGPGGFGQGGFGQGGSGPGFGGGHHGQHHGGHHGGLGFVGGEDLRSHAGFDGPGGPSGMGGPGGHHGGPPGRGPF